MRMCLYYPIAFRFRINACIIYINFRNDVLVPGSVAQFWLLLDHSNKCGSQSMNMKKTGNLKLIGNVLKLPFHLMCLIN